VSGFAGKELAILCLPNSPLRRAGACSRFRRAQFRNLGRLAKSHAEHDRTVNAIVRGDHKGAADAMRRHIMAVCEEYDTYAAR
jgi:DNA-binding GntR family transcriptional regulator